MTRRRPRQRLGGPAITSLSRLLPLLALASLMLTGPSAASPGPPAPGPILYGVTVDRVTHLVQMRSALAKLPQPAAL